jgi:hypothetical protein
MVAGFSPLGFVACCAAGCAWARLLWYVEGADSEATNATNTSEIGVAMSSIGIIATSPYSHDNRSQHLIEEDVTKHACVRTRILGSRVPTFGESRRGKEKKNPGVVDYRL